MANMEATTETNTQQHIPPSTKYTLLVICCVILAIGNSGGPLIMRLYFIHHGERIWLSSWLQSAGWPLILLLLIPVYFRRRATAPTTFFLMKPRLFVASAVIGTLTGLDSYLYAYGVSRLPVSTSSLLLASQLAFTAAFAFLLVKQKFTSYSINAVVLLTVGAGILALHTSSDRPEGVTKKEYFLGFLLTLFAAVLYGFILPLVELTYRKAKQVITYTLVLEIQIVICLFATLFSTVGMLVNKDFQAIPREARHFGIGEARYYIVLVCSGIIWQFYFLGAIGIIFCSSSLLSGIVVAFLLPVTEILAVICYQEKFQAEKGVSLLLSLWGFVSYFYGEFKYSKKIRQFEAEMELPRNHQMIAA